MTPVQPYQYCIENHLPRYTCTALYKKYLGVISQGVNSLDQHWFNYNHIENTTKVSNLVHTETLGLVGQQVWEQFFW